MTAPAAAPASGPVAPPVQRASAQPPTDRFAFAAVLDALPAAASKAGASKAGASTAEDQPHVAKEPREDGSSSRQSARHSLLSDGALLASLPFALGAASAIDAGSQAAGQASSPALAAAKASGAEAGGASVAASDRSTAVGRLVGERAFHFTAGSPSAFASRGLTGEASFALAGASGQDLATQVNRSGEGAVAAGFATAEAAPGAGAAPSGGVAAASAPVAPRARASQAHRASPTRATAAHEAVHGERGPEATAASAPARVASSAAPAPADSRGDGTDGRLPDPTGSNVPSLAKTDPFGALFSAPFAAVSSFGLDGSTTTAAGADVTPRASAPAASPAAAGQPVKEIDVDLSPGGLEDVSMTMRLAGDKLSVVIRAGSSQTLSSIEGARDAIADRMAAIGQPLDSLTVKQMGVSTNGNSASAGDGSGGGERRSAQGASEGGDSNDAWSRRGADRDRSF